MQHTWRKCLLIISMCLSTGTGFAADFRDATWGMTRDQIVALHPGELPADRRIGAIGFDGTLAGLDVLIFYRFDEQGLLFEAGYEINTEDVAALTIVEQYNTLNGLLLRRYPDAGAPQQIWRNRLFADKPEEWGRAVNSRHLTYQWQFTGGRTRVEHTLQRGRRDISHMLLYAAVGQQSDQDVLDQL